MNRTNPLLVMSRLGALAILLALAAACSDDGGGGSGADMADASSGSDASSDDTSGQADGGEDDVEADAPEEETPEEALARYTERGPYAVGVSTFVVTDDAREGRELTVSVWYPAVDGAEEGFAVEELVQDAAQRQTYAELLAAAPEGCPTPRTGAAMDAALSDAEATWPVVVFSHCLQCIRFSSFSVAEHLASHGVVVAAPNHTSDTVFDALDGASSQLSDDFLQVRAGDVRFVLDLMLGERPGGPAALEGKLDAARVGVFGHSFGAVTTGRVLQTDDRPVAGLALAAPVENPLFPSVVIAEIDKPLLLMVAREDNSISEFGNELMRLNFADANPPVWKIEVDDAGHWSFSDICALTESFDPGCGEDERQTTPGETFTYLPVAEGLRVARTYAATWFAAHLQGDDAAMGALELPLNPEGIQVDVRKP